MNEKRYFLHPGEVKSKNDDDVHYISAPELARLYGLDYKKCHIIYDEHRERYAGYKKQPGDIHLWPKYSGDYKIIK